METIVWDTSVYITKFRTGLSWEDRENNTLILSSVVAAELAAGHTNNSNDLIRFKNYVNGMFLNNRVLIPSFLNWYDTGVIIGRLIRSRPDLKNKKALLFNDCLIAISSTQINAKVITSNIKDFELIKRYVNFDVSYQMS